MTPEQRISQAPLETEGRPFKEVIILNREAVIIDNMISLKYSRFRSKRPKNKVQVRQRLNIVAAKNQRINSPRAILSPPVPDEAAEGFRIVRYSITARNPVIRVGRRYDIVPQLIYTEDGHGVLLKITPSPKGHAIVAGLSSEKISHGLSTINNSPQAK